MFYTCRSLSGAAFLSERRYLLYRGCHVQKRCKHNNISNSSSIHTNKVRSLQSALTELQAAFFIVAKFVMGLLVSGFLDSKINFHKICEQNY